MSLQVPGPALLSDNTTGSPAGSSPVGTSGITATQVAYGDTTANTIKGSSQLVFVQSDSLKLAGDAVTNGFQIYNTSDQTTNVQRLEALFSSSNGLLGTRTLGTIAATPLFLYSQTSNNGNAWSRFDLQGASLTGSSGPYFRFGMFTSQTGVGVQSNSSALTGAFLSVVGPTQTNTSGASSIVSITPTYNQASGNAANTDLLVNRTQTLVGSGAQRLMDLQVGGVTQFNVTNTGVATTSAAIATPAGGSTSAVLLFGSTAGFGIYYGSGAPSVSAGQGSLYLRSDGSTSTSRSYINNSAVSGTTWTAITTVA